MREILILSFENSEENILHEILSSVRKRTKGYKFDSIKKIGQRND